jgi:hypothetical protein
LRESCPKFSKELLVVHLSRFSCPFARVLIEFRVHEKRMRKVGRVSAYCSNMTKDEEVGPLPSRTGFDVTQRVAKVSVNHCGLSSVMSKNYITEMKTNKI